MLMMQIAKTHGRLPCLLQTVSTIAVIKYQQEQNTFRFANSHQIWSPAHAWKSIPRQTSKHFPAQRDVLSERRKEDCCGPDETT